MLENVAKSSKDMLCSFKAQSLATTNPARNSQLWAASTALYCSRRLANFLKAWLGRSKPIPPLFAKGWRLKEQNQQPLGGFTGGTQVLTHTKMISNRAVIWMVFPMSGCWFPCHLLKCSQIWATSAATTGCPLSMCWIQEVLSFGVQVWVDALW